ncbi:HIT family protein, partial [Klebsiella pneumoniae]|nr:HIT family protein [Klebsiella pneumoniae]
LRRSVTPACQNQQLNAGNDAERPRSPARRNIEANPVSPGHSLVIPVREITTWFDATLEEWESALRIVAAVKEQLDEALAPDGYN